MDNVSDILVALMKQREKLMRYEERGWTLRSMTVLRAMDTYNDLRSQLLTTDPAEWVYYCDLHGYDISHKGHDFFA